MTKESSQIALLKRRMKMHSLAWDLIFYKRIGGSVTVALVGTHHEITHWARWRKKEMGFTRWISVPYPEFNDRYNGRFQIASNPSWGLVRKPI